MTTGEFTAEDWIERLAGALAELVETQKRYPDELDQQRQQRVRSESKLFRRSAFDDPAADLRTFYGHAARAGRSFADRYAPLRAALAEVQRILAAHPAWASLVEPADGRGEFSIWILNHGSSESLLSIISGLMVRGMAVRQDGFSVAAAELHGLLEPEGDLERMPGSHDLLVGYHVTLFYGLRVSKEVPLADNMALLPFRQLKAFANEDMLQTVAPAVIHHNLQQAVGALVQSFRWQPEFRKQGESADPDLDWGGSFLTDAEAFVELLALFHAAPVMSLVRIPYCTHRRASHLLGLPYYHASYDWGRAARPFDPSAGSTELREDALAEAGHAFKDRNSAQYRYCAPIIARLAEALTRSGRLGTDDRILDVALALERLYKPGEDATTFTLKTRAACFLETGTQDRLRVLQDVEEFSKVRAAIIHGGKRLSATAKNEAFGKGFEIARRSVVKLLRDGLPEPLPDGAPNWDKVVIAGADC